MENIDLNIENYSLEDVLNLFKINHDFGEEELKQAKRIALKTHPDKSGLSKEIFIFFGKAYNLILDVYNFKNKTEKEVKNVEYNKDDIDNEERNIELLKKRLKGKSRDDFSNWFNTMFEQSHENKKQIGYGDWLKSDNDLNNIKAKNMNEFNKIFRNKKKEGRELILHQKVNELVFNGGGSMIDDSESVYSSDIFSKLKYEDLKKAHIETVVPVTEEDFTSKKRFDSVEKYIRYRDSQRGNPLDLNKSKNILHDQSLQNEKLSSQRAYNLLQQDREMKDRNKKWWKNLKLLNE
mgnify:CR=1 FL=1